MRKIYIIPNLVTTLGMLAGFYSIVAAFNYEFVTAAWAILVAGIFDSLDGRIARLARATSSFGVEYDSLADLVSFGLAPALLMFCWTLESLGRPGWLACFLFVACGALRLARFNVMVGTISKAFFQGLPIPIAALGLATFVLFDVETGWPGGPRDVGSRAVSMVLVLGLSALMVSTVLFPSFKELNWRSKATFGYLMAALGIAVAIISRPDFFMFIVVIAYVGLSLGWNLYRVVRRKKKYGEAKT